MMLMAMAEAERKGGYRSVVAFGRIRIVEDRAAKAALCGALMARYGDPRRERPAASYARLEQIGVCAIAVDRPAGRETPLPVPEDRWPRADRTTPLRARP